MRMHKWYFAAALFAATTVSGADVPAGHTPAKPAEHADAHIDPHAAAPAPKADAPAETIQSPDDSLRRLIEGNERYLTSLVTHPNSDAARRCDTFTNGQHPFAAVLACADSRVPVEMLFDHGIGDLFVVRVAGNVSDTDEIGTLEYGAEHLHTPLIVVLGHSKCGAVTAVVNETKVSENIAKLVDNIVPAVATAKKNLPGAKGETLIQAAIDANVMQSVADLLAHSEEIRQLVAGGKVKVVGAVYDIHIGSIRWLGEHPRQSQLLQGTTTTAAHEPGEELLQGLANKSAHAETPAIKDNHAASHNAADSHLQSKPSANHNSDQTHGNKAPAAVKEQGHAGPSASANSPSMPHENGTMKGMLIPGAFLGGAGLASGVVFHFIKGKKPLEGVVEHVTTSAAAEPAPAAA